MLISFAKVKEYIPRFLKKSNLFGENVEKIVLLWYKLYQYTKEKVIKDNINKKIS